MHGASLLVREAVSTRGIFLVLWILASPDAIRDGSASHAERAPSGANTGWPCRCI